MVGSVAAVVSPVEPEEAAEVPEEATASVVYSVMMNTCSRELTSAAGSSRAYLARPVYSKPASTMVPIISPRGYTVEPEVTTCSLFRIMAAEGR